MIAVIDYKAGNLTSVLKALSAVGAREVTVTDDPEQVLDAEKILLPGVGHFAATQRLQERGINAAVGQSIARGTPFLGICVGLQWLFQGSTESPETPGLGVFPGVCARFPAQVKSPHVGWNSLKITGPSKLLSHVESDPYVYFTHSYRAPVCDATAGVTEYGGVFTAVVERENVMGVQFHPEKSSEVGLQVLRNFLAC